MKNQRPIYLKFATSQRSIFDFRLKKNETLYKITLFFHPIRSNDLCFFAFRLGKIYATSTEAEFDVQNWFVW